MNPSLTRCPKVFTSAKNDLRALHSPGKHPALSNRRPAKLCCGASHWDECDVDDEESTASPLYTETPHTSHHVEDLAFSPFAPSIPHSPNHTQTSFKTDKYLSKKERPLTHRASLSSMNVTPPKKQVPALRSLRPHFMRASLPSERKNPLFPSDGVAASKALCFVVKFCRLRMIAALTRVNSEVHKACRNRVRELMVAGLDHTSRQRYWRHIALSTQQTDFAGRYFRPSHRCPQEIRNDIMRTPILAAGMFSERQQKLMMRLLDAVAGYDSQVGYCQGMNYIAGLLVQVVDNEEDCFWLFISLMRTHKLKKLLMPGLASLQLCCFQLDCLLQHYLPALSAHLKSLGVSSEVFAAKWFVTLLSYELPSPTLVRVWDLFFAHGWKLLFRVILAMMKKSERELLTADSASIAGMLADVAENCGESVLTSAFEFKVTRRLLKELKKLQNCNGRYQLEKGEDNKLRWVVIPEYKETARSSESNEDSFAFRLLSKVLYLFRRDEPSTSDEANLESTISLEECPVPAHSQAILKDFSEPKTQEEIAIKDLDSGRVYYIDLSQEHCFMCGANTHSSRYCTADVSGALWVFPDKPRS